MGYKAWYGNPIWDFKRTTILFAKLTSRSWPKTSSSRADLAKIACVHGWRLITCTHGCRQVQKHTNVKLTSQARIMTNGMGIVHDILSQPRDFLRWWPPILANNEQVQGWFGPNCMYAWLQTPAEALQSQHWFIRKVYKAWDGNRALCFHQNTQFPAKLTPKFGQKWPIPGLLWPK